jgi:hypothetical protein
MNLRGRSPQLVPLLDLTAHSQDGCSCPQTAQWKCFVHQRVLDSTFLRRRYFSSSLARSHLTGKFLPNTVAEKLWISDRLGMRLTVTAMHRDHDTSADSFHGSYSTLSVTVSTSLPHWAPGGPGRPICWLSDAFRIRITLKSRVSWSRPGLRPRNKPEFPGLLTRLARADSDASADPTGRRPAGGDSESPSWRCIHGVEGHSSSGFY